jgi:hypothetical protein
MAVNILTAVDSIWDFPGDLYQCPEMNEFEVKLNGEILLE